MSKTQSLLGNTYGEGPGTASTSFTVLLWGGLNEWHSFSPQGPSTLGQHEIPQEELTNHFVLNNVQMA